MDASATSAKSPRWTDLQMDKVSDMEEREVVSTAGGISVPPSESNQQIEQDNASLADSAYVSLTRSTGMSLPNTPLDVPNSPSRKYPRKIPGTTDMWQFFHSIDEDTKEHYRRNRAGIEGLLMEEVLALGLEPEAVMTRLLVVGKSEETARQRLVIICDPEAESAIRTLLTCDHMTPYLRPRNQSISRLEPYFIPVKPRMRSSCSDVDVCCDNTFVSKQGTYCGAPITLMSGQQKLGQKRTWKATSGGVIRVDRGNGEPELYGMTAGHSVEGLLQQGERQESNAQVACEHDILGSVLDPRKLPGVAAGQALPSHDWALFEIKIKMPNTAVPIVNECPGVPENDAVHHILAAKRPRFEDGVSDPVLLLSGTHGTQRGELSSNSARIWIGHSRTFVDAYILELEEGYSTSVPFIPMRQQH